MTRFGVLVLAALVLGCGHEVDPTSDYLDGDALPVPENFTAVLEFGRVILTWEAEEGVFAVIDGWYLDRAFGPDPESLGPYARLNAEPHQDRIYVDVHVEDGYTYAYRIRAVTPAGVLGNPASAAVRVDLTPPDPPAGLTAVQETRNGAVAVVLSWQAVAGEEYPNYHVFRLPPFPNFDRVITPNTGLEDFAVEPLITYRYWVVTVDQAGNQSEPTPVVLIQVQP